jgi:UDP-3-O-[3-hydroxymyristoyl] N-acetylglucosamine deacetylase
LFSFSGAGTSSRRTVEVRVFKGKAGSGIRFLAKHPQTAGDIVIPAHADFVVSTLRNVVLGKDGARVCFVEHILAAAALWGAKDLVIEVDGPEIPLGDGSASFWIELFEQSSLKQETPKPLFTVKEPYVVAKGDRQIIALPGDQFSIAYLIDWQHPAIGKRWCVWYGDQPLCHIANARTFNLKSEQDMLGLSDNFVSLTDEGFSKPLRFEDEPVRHKLLDLFGDLTLLGVNPLAIKAQFISIKGGHELDVQLVRGILKQGLAELEG